MPSNNKNIIGDLRGKFDPHYKLASNVEGIQKGLGIEVAQIHKTLSKSFVTQRKTLTRVLGLEKRVSDNETKISNLGLGVEIWTAREDARRKKEEKEKAALAEQAAAQAAEEAAAAEAAEELEQVAEEVQQAAEKVEEVAEELGEEIPEGLDDVLDDIRGDDAEVGSTKTKTKTKPKSKKKVKAKPKAKKKPVAKKKGKKSFSKVKGKVKAEKFFNLAQEVRAEGTLGGKTLTPEQRKAGFKAAKDGEDSVSWKKFLDEVEQTNAASDEGITPNTKMLPGSSDMGQGVLEGIATDVKSILGVIDSRTEAEEDAADEIKQEKEKDTRKDKEEKKEAKANKKGPLPGFIKKATAPVENILGAIVKTFSLLLAGWGITKLLDWLGNPKNAKAVEELKDFITVALPPILKGILALVALDIGLKVFAFAKMLASGSLKLLMGLKQMAIGVAKWAMANPRLALAMGLGAAAIGLFLSSDGGTGGGDTEQGTSDNNIDSEVELNGGGLVPVQKFKEGGFVSGPGGVDKVPAKLTAGEFVMSKGAVQKYGVGTLANMNAAGGGTNRPTMGRYKVGGLAKQGVVTNPEERQKQESYMLKHVNEERALRGMEPLTHLTYAPGVELTKMRGPGPRTKETSNTNMDFDTGLKTTSQSKTVDGKTTISGGMSLITQEDRDKFFAENPHAKALLDLKNQAELDNLGSDISASAKRDAGYNGGGLVQAFQGGGLVSNSISNFNGGGLVSNSISNFNGGGLVPIQNFQGGGGVRAIKTATQLMNSVPGDSGSSGSSGATILPVPSGSGSGNAGNSGSVDNLVMFSPVDGDNLSSLIMKSMYSILD